MTDLRRTLPATALLAIAALLLGCRADPPRPASEASTTPTPSSRDHAEVPAEAPAEPSVRPGINDRFLSDDLDVERFSGIFEGESREVFAEREGLTAALQLEPGMAVADIGAGTGLFEPLFARAVGASGTVYAVDISPRFLDHLRERSEQEGWGNVRVVAGSARATGLAPASVDVAFICDTYHHFEYPRSTLADLLAVVRPGGTLVVVDFERIPGFSEDWILEHVRAGKEVFRSEITRAGFELIEEVDVPGVRENYVLRFRRP